MRIVGERVVRVSASLAFIFALMVSNSFGQNDDARVQQRSRTTTMVAAANGEKVKLKGRVSHRTGDTFSIRDQRGNETVFLLTDRTSVKSKGGFFRRGQDYDVTSLLRGLPVEVEGIGNAEGQVIAQKVRFNSSDLKVAQTVDSRVVPVEEASQRMSGQIDELNTMASNTNERISALDDFDVQDSVAVYFATGSAVLTTEAKRSLDELARKAMTSKGYVIEVAGFADATGSVERNRILSQRRADAVVSYLRENFDIPLRRMITPAGYGEAKSVADNNTADGRRQNRRVEVKILISRGLTRTTAGGQ
jgi:OmpA-OmpF porin, OOP family